jgi:hypothetical protein
MASSDRFVAVGEEEIVEKGQQQNYRTISIELINPVVNSN